MDKIGGNSMPQTLKQMEEIISKGPYFASWESLNQFHTPDWFCDAKFGLFIHWGLYSVPAFHNEWYSRNMYREGTVEFEHHIKTYGLQKDFGYKDFIPIFTASEFNPDKWAALFKESGAKYVFPVAEHHDGFQMYRSEISHFNAFEMGPKRDILGELKTSLEKEEIAFCTSSHRGEHWFFMSGGKTFDSDIKEPLKKGDFYWPSMPEPDHQDLFGKPYPSTEFLEDWLLRTCEIIDSYQPRVLYFDWWIQHESFKPYLMKLAAYYYNQGIRWGKPAAICYKHDAMMFGSGIVEVERGKFADAKPYYWQTDTAVAKNSWCYTDTLEYKDSKDIILNLIDVVSKNGNLLLNIGPKADGTIPEGDEKILKEIGAWLRINGEAIYKSKMFRKSAEGPTKEMEGQFTDNNGVSYTKEDFRFTVKGSDIYVFVMNPEAGGMVQIRSLAQSANQNIPEFHGIIKGVKILGEDKVPEYYTDEKGLFVNIGFNGSKIPIVIRVNIL